MTIEYMMPESESPNTDTRKYCLMSMGPGIPENP